MHGTKKKTKKNINILFFLKQATYYNVTHLDAHSEKQYMIDYNWGHCWKKHLKYDRNQHKVKIKVYSFCRPSFLISRSDKFFIIIYNIICKKYLNIFAFFRLSNMHQTLENCCQKKWKKTISPFYHYYPIVIFDLFHYRYLSLK